MDDYSPTLLGYLRALGAVNDLEGERAKENKI
jgi:hypothetical protein